MSDMGGVNSVNIAIAVCNKSFPLCRKEINNPDENSENEIDVQRGNEVLSEGTQEYGEG
jgi:hypothetical protein